jgi:hypothetical protein
MQPETHPKDEGIQVRLTRDETSYVLDTLQRCEGEGHFYYVHSRYVSDSVKKRLEGEDLFVHREPYTYTYVCRKENKEQAVAQMPTHHKD